MHKEPTRRGHMRRRIDRGFRAHTKRMIITQVEFAIGHAEEQTNKPLFYSDMNLHDVQLTRE